MTLRRKSPLRNKKPFKASRSALRKGRLTPKKRTKAEQERIYGTQAFRDYLHAAACLWCGKRVGIQQAHFGKHAMGKKNDWTRTGPLDALCHDAYDRRSSRVYWFTGADRELLEARLAQFHAQYARLAQRAGRAPQPTEEELAATPPRTGD